MQLPGLITLNQRITLEITWCPSRDDYGISMVTLEEDDQHGGWTTEALWSTGTPVHAAHYRDQARRQLEVALDALEALRSEHNFPPFP